MTRGLLSVSLCAAALAWAAPVGAKPPDLPLDQTYLVFPQIPHDWTNWLMPLPPPAEQPQPAVPGDVMFPPILNPQPTPPVLPSLFQLSPTPRRHLTSLLLLGAHPLLMFAPTEYLLDVPSDHPCPAPMLIPQPEIFHESVLSPNGTGDAALQGLLVFQQVTPDSNNPPKKSSPSQVDPTVPPPPVPDDSRREDLQYSWPEDLTLIEKRILIFWEVCALEKECEVLFKEGKYEEASSRAEAILKLDPNNSKAIDTLRLTKERLTQVRANSMQSHTRTVEFPSNRVSTPPVQDPPQIVHQAPQSLPEISGGSTVKKDSGNKERDIERRLKQPISVNFKDTPLRDVVANLRDLTGINIVIDQAALDENDLNDQLPVTIRLDRVSVKSALKLILHTPHLEYTIRDEVLLITNEEGAHGKLTVKAYSVADLMQMKLGPKEGQSIDAKQLIRLITNKIEPRRWTENGGRGTIDFYPLTTSLVVNQTPDVQEQLESLLTALRQLQEWQQEEERDFDALGVEAQVSGLMKACRILHASGNMQRAGELAREAFALDPERVLDDPFVAHLYIRARQELKGHGGQQNKCTQEPATCPAGYGRSAAPVHDILQKGPPVNNHCERGIVVDPPPVVVEVSSSPPVTPVPPKVDSKVAPIYEVVMEESELKPVAADCPKGEAKPYRLGKDVGPDFRPGEAKGKGTPDGQIFIWEMGWNPR
jgi:hypothetical protein